MAETILVVDDEIEIANLIEVYLCNEGYTVKTYNTAQSAMECIQNEEIELAILDIMLPDMDGFALCQYIRSRSTYPIIMLTAKDQETDKITGLSLGADDYVTKPFRPLELVARVKSQLRRYKRYNTMKTMEERNNVYIHSDIELDAKAHQCHVNGKPVMLTPTEFSILRILLENKGNVVSAEELFRQIWQGEYYTKDNNTITVHIRHLREKLGDTTEKPKYIKTIWGVGYKIET